MKKFKKVNLTVGYCEECPFSYYSYEENYGEPIKINLICQLNDNVVLWSGIGYPRRINIPQSCQLEDKKE